MGSAWLLFGSTSSRCAITKPDNFSAAEGTEVKLNRCYVIGSREDHKEFEDRLIPCYAATESKDGKLATLIQKLDDVKGPSKAFLEKIEEEVNTEMDQKIKEAEAHPDLTRPMP